jgi:hypothetical protein
MAASPLEYFRKNQRIIMAILVVISLIAFVLVPGTGSLQEVRSILGNGQGEKLVSWKGTQLGVNELSRLQQVKTLTINVFSKVASEVIKAGGQPRVPGFQMGPQGVVNLGIDSQQPYSYGQIVELQLMAETARKHGIVVSDEAVDRFIQEFTDGRISARRFEEIIQELAGRTLSRHDMYEFLKAEMAKQLLVQMGQSAVVDPLASDQNPVTAVPPSQNWLNFKKFQEKTRIEAYPVFVDDFLAKVTEKPSEQELRTIYEEGKARLTPANDPRPGFTRGYQSDIEYVSFSIDSFVKDEGAKITDEVLKAEYDKRVVDQGAYRVPIEDSPPASETPQTSPAPEKGAESSSAGTAAATEEKPVGAEPAKAEPSSEASSKEPPASAAGSEAGAEKPAAASEAQPSASGPASPADAPASSDVPAPAEPAAKPEPGQSSMSPSLAPEGSAVRLVAFQDEAKAAPEAAKGEGNESAPSPANPATSPVDATPQTPAAGEPATPAAPAATEPASGAVNPAASEAGTSEAGASEAGAAAPAKVEDKPMRTRTFEEVRDELRNEMARQPALERMQMAMTSVREAMDRYYHESEMYRTKDPSDTSLAKPEQPSLAKLADDYGLTYGKTGLVDIFGAQELPVGRSIVRDGQNFFQGPPLTQFFFNPRFPRYRPVEANGFDGQGILTYIAWKVEDVPARIPAFEEVREAVEKAWRTSRARMMATEKAKEIAAGLEATNDADPWPAVLEESVRNLVVKPPAFTWLQMPMMQGGTPGLSQIEGIFQPGAVLMERVFTTPVGKATYALDEAQQKCFVMRVVERTPSEQELLTAFERAPSNMGAQVLAGAESMTSYGGFFRSISEEVGLDMTRLQEFEGQ